MAINLVKYKDEMLQAWREVVEDKNPTDWALYTYEGQSYDLKLFSKGGNTFLLVVWKPGFPYFDWSS